MRAPPPTLKRLPSALPPVASSPARAAFRSRSAWSFVAPSAIVTIGRRFNVRIRISGILGLFLVAATGSLGGGDKPGGPSYVDHARLLVYRDAENREHPVRSKEDWFRRRRHIVEGMERAMGPLPDRSQLPPLDVRVVEKVDGDAYTRLTISYVADEGDRAPASRSLPARRTRDERRPAMLALHPTGPAGKGIVDDQGSRPHRGYAKELAQRGYVVLAPDYPSFGDYKQYDFN